MLWVDRVGDRRSQAILAQHFAENNRGRHNNDENEPAPRTVSQEQLRDETMSKKETKQY